MNACSTVAPVDAIAAELGYCAPSAQPFQYDADLLFSSRVLFAPTHLESDAEAIDQSRSGEGLRQEANCSRLQGSGTGGLVGEGGDEYERRAITLGANHRQEFQSAHARHLQICDHARRVIQTARLQEVLGGRIGLDRVPVRPQKLAGCRTNRRVVVDDGNN
jgi:hypothetical protein